MAKVNNNIVILSYRHALIILTLIWLALGWPWLSGAVTIPWDAKAHWYPHFVFLHNALKSGTSFLWTPNIFAGSPEIADPQSAIFQVPLLITALFAYTPVAMDRAVLTTILAGGIAIVTLFKDRGEAMEGGVIAALAFGFGAAVCWRLQHINQVMATAMVPITLVFLDRAFDRKSIFYGALAGLFASLILIGRDQVALLAIYWLTFYALYRIYIHEDRLKLIKPMLAGLVVAFILIPVPFLLTYYWAELSNRPVIDEFSAGRGSLHPVNFLTWIIGNLFGAGSDFSEHWGAPSLHFKETDLFLARNMNVLYMGILPIILLINGAFQRKNMVFIVSVVVFMLYALGKYTPAFTLLYKLPFVSIYRRPADAVFLVGLFSAILAGMAWNKPFNVKLNSVIFGGAVLIGLALAYWKGTITIAYDEILTSSALIIATFAALYFYRSKKSYASFAVLLAVFAVDLRLTNGPSESTGLPPSTYDVLLPETKNETIAYLKANLRPLERVELRGLGYHWQNASLVHGFHDILGFNPLRDGVYSDIVGTEDVASLMEQRRFTKQFPNYRSPLAAQLSLRFLVTGKPVAGLTPVKVTKDGYIYEFTPRRRVQFDAGKILELKYGNDEISVKVTSDTGGLLIIRDVHHPWWEANVNGEEVEIDRVELLFRGIEVPAGEAHIKLTFRPFKNILEEGLPIQIFEKKEEEETKDDDKKDDKKAN